MNMLWRLATNERATNERATNERATNERRYHQSSGRYTRRGLEELS